jgi:hypothetical protein
MKLRIKLPFRTTKEINIYIISQLLKSIIHQEITKDKSTKALNY